MLVISVVQTESISFFVYFILWGAVIPRLESVALVDSAICKMRELVEKREKEKDGLC